MLTDVFKVIVNNLFKESSYRKKKKKKTRLQKHPQ